MTNIGEDTVATTSDRPTPSSKRAEQARRLAWLEAQAPLGWAVILVLVATLGSIYLRQASGTAAIGRHIQELQLKLDDLKRENAALERDIAEAQSLEYLQSEARKLGFIPPSPYEIEYLIIPDYPVTVEVTPIPTPAPLPEPIESMNEALWLALKARLSSLVRGVASE